MQACCSEKTTWNKQQETHESCHRQSQHKTEWEREVERDRTRGESRDRGWEWGGVRWREAPVSNLPGGSSWTVIAWPCHFKTLLFRGDSCPRTHTLYTRRSATRTQTHMRTHTYTKDEERFGMVSGHCLTLPCLTPPHPWPPQGFLALMACPLTILEDDGVVGVCAFLSASKEW